MNSHYSNIHSSEEKDGGDSIDIDKILMIVRKNIFWILLIMLVTNGLAYLYLRYTRPIYESSSVIKLDIKSEANILGLNTVNQNLDHIAGEIELLKSNMFFSRVVNALDMEISYYAQGRFLFQERYNNSPFSVAYDIIDPSFYDRPINVDILDHQKFELSYGPEDDGFAQIYHFGEEIITPHFKLTISLTENFVRERDHTKFYFVVNSHQAQLAYLGSNMTVQPVNFNANTIRISFQGYDKQKVRDMVHVIDSVYLQYTQEKKNQATEQKLAFLDEQLGTIEQRLSKYESYFENFTINNKTNDLESEIGKAITRMEELDAQKYVLHNLQESINQFRKKIDNNQEIVEPDMFADFPEEVSQTIEQLNKLLNERALMLGSYKENTFAVKRKDQQISLLKAEISDLLDKNAKGVAQEIRQIDQKKQEIEEAFVRLPSKGTQYGKNQRYYSLYEEIFLSLIQKKNELEITKAGTVTDFVVLLPATVPQVPIAPARMSIYGIGAAAGCMISLFFVVVSYMLNNKIGSRSELERLIARSVLGSVPYYAKAKSRKNKLIVSLSPKSSISEAFRAIRTNIQFMGIHGEKKIISITSTISSEGKTFFASNLGYIMAMSGKRVVLVDVDLRKPKVHFSFEHENSLKGVSTYLIGEYPIQECIVNSGADYYDYIPAGPIPPNPSELIESLQFDRMLEELKAMYDIIIVDTPPVGLVTDGMLIMEKADLPIYVFRADYSKRTFVKTLNRVQKTHKFKNISVVLNALSHSSDRDYGYNKYGYGYYDDEDDNQTLWASVKDLLSIQS